MEGNPFTPYYAHFMDPQARPTNIFYDILRHYNVFADGDNYHHEVTGVLPSEDFKVDCYLSPTPLILVHFCFKGKSCEIQSYSRRTEEEDLALTEFTIEITFSDLFFMYITPVEMDKVLNRPCETFDVHILRGMKDRITRFLPSLG